MGVFFFPSLFISFSYDTFFFFPPSVSISRLTHFFSVYILISTYFFIIKKRGGGNDVPRQRRRSYVWSDCRWSSRHLAPADLCRRDGHYTARLKSEEEDEEAKKKMYIRRIWRCPHFSNSYQTIKRKILYRFSSLFYFIFYLGDFFLAFSVSKSFGKKMK